MRYFVTGATGFVGGRVARQLLGSGHAVVALVRDRSRAEGLAQRGATLAEGDVTVRESMRAPMTDVDGVFHIAGWYKVGVRDKSPGIAVNIEGTRNVLELMQELNVPRGVHTSSLAVNSDTGGRVVDESYRYEGSHLSEYDRTKAVAHDLAEQFIRDGLPLVIVQPGLVYGPGDRGPTHDALVRYLKGRLPAVPRGTAYCWTHVDDAADGHLKAMERGLPGESYHICGPAGTFAKVLELAEELTGVPAPPTVPAWPLKAVVPLVSVVERVISVPEQFTSEYLRSSAGVTYLGSNHKARRQLGWQPRPLREGLPETLQDEMRRLGTDWPG